MSAHGRPGSGENPGGDRESYQGVGFAGMAAGVGTLPRLVGRSPHKRRTPMLVTCGGALTPNQARRPSIAPPAISRQRCFPAAGSGVPDVRPFRNCGAEVLA